MVDSFPLAARALTWVKLVVAGVSLWVKLLFVHVGFVLHNVVLVSLPKCLCAYLIHSRSGLYRSNLKTINDLVKYIICSFCPVRKDLAEQEAYICFCSPARKTKSLWESRKWNLWTSGKAQVFDRCGYKSVTKEIEQDIGFRKCLLFRKILNSAI